MRDMLTLKYEKMPFIQVVIVVKEHETYYSKRRKYIQVVV
jgi:hypothetical protein